MNKMVERVMKEIREAYKTSQIARFIEGCKNVDYVVGLDREYKGALIELRSLNTYTAVIDTTAGTMIYASIWDRDGARMIPLPIEVVSAIDDYCCERYDYGEE